MPAAEYFADLHIHVGRAENGQWVKIPTSAHLTVRNILTESAQKKGLDMIGIADAICPPVQSDLARLQEEGVLEELPGGGYRCDGGPVLVLGAEIETTEEDGGSSHTLVYLPDLRTMAAFTRTMSSHIRNIQLSSQNAHMTLRRLVGIAAGFDAQIIPAHLFTPHKGALGACAPRLEILLGDRGLDSLAAVELGLSADTSMADRLSELASLTFVTNSDAHSTAKIAREYNSISMSAPDYTELSMALRRQRGRRITGNFGLDPRLGKYHHTLCDECGRSDESSTGAEMCSHCGSRRITPGVFNRIAAIADRETAVHPGHRPPYRCQTPLEFLPGVGPKTLARLVREFGSEMHVLHRASPDDLARVAGRTAARRIIDSREGRTVITAGAGGVYGKLM